MAPRPSVDVLFLSCANQLGLHATSAILTGMGRDGDAGMLAMRSVGSYTVAQDEESCVVFGMPKEAIAAGGAVRVVPLDRIAGELIAAVIGARSGHLRETASGSRR